MSIDEPVHDLIQSLYDAAVDEPQWPAVLKKLADFTGSQAATLWVLDGSAQPCLPSFTYINFDPRFIAEYLDQVAPLDPTVQYLVRHPHQAIVHDGLVITERDKNRHPYYDWHHRHSDTRFRLVGQMSPARALQAGVALHRTRKAGRYDLRDIEQFTMLHRHLERALAIAFRLGTLGAMQYWALELLDRNPAAVLILDSRGRVIHTNRSASELCVAGEGIRVSAEGVALLRKQDDDCLQGLIADAMCVARSASASPAASPGGAMRAARPSGKRPYAILVTPVTRRYSGLSALRPAVWVVIADPDRQAKLPNDRLRAVFGLTEAEARLAALLGAGEELRVVADKLGITYGTARARLAQIFEKTRTRRQSELIKVLSAIVAVG